MNNLTNAIAVLIENDAVGLFVFGLALLAVLHTAVSVGRSRQWYVLPVIFGLTALAGFLLNPLADSSTMLDLRTRLTGYETLTLLCIAQFLLVGASMAFGLALDGRRAEERSRLGLAIVGTIPAPALVIVMLLLEQTALSAAAARPEAVGREIGFAVAIALTAATAAAMCLPSRWLAMPHIVLSVAMVLVSMVTPLLQDPLPQPMAIVDWESLRWFAFVMPVAIAVVLAGFIRSASDKRRLSA